VTTLILLTRSSCTVQQHQLKRVGAVMINNFFFCSSSLLIYRASACRHAERDTILANPSVRLSVCPSHSWYYIKTNEYIVKLFPLFAKGQVAMLPPLQIFKGNSLIGGVKYTGEKKKLPIFDRTRRLSRKRYEIDQWILLIGSHR